MTCGTQAAGFSGLAGEGAAGLRPGVSVAREHGGFSRISVGVRGAADFGGIGIEGGGDGFFDERGVDAEPEVAGEEFDEGFAFGRMEGGEACGELLDAVHRGRCLEESADERGGTCEIEGFGVEMEFLEHQAGGAGEVFLGEVDFPVAFLARTGNGDECVPEGGGIQQMGAVPGAPGTGCR